MYYKSHWISCYVNNAFKRSYLRMPRSRFCSHHMPVTLLFLPLQRCENSEGGPPCNSMPLVWHGLTMCVVNCSYFLVRHRVSKIMLLFCLGSSCQSLKVREVKCVPGDPTTMFPVLFKGSHSLLCYACGYGIVCQSISICGSILIYYKQALLVYGCMHILRV